MRTDVERKPKDRTDVSRLVSCICLAAVLMLAGCAQSAHQSGRDLLDKVLPDTLQRQIDQTVTFADLRANPGSYQGKTVMVSGVVVKSKRGKERTEVEVLQIPTGSGAVPTKDRSRSEGRFLAVKKDLDPAVVDAGTPVTIVGEVLPPITRALDEGEYTYPVLEIKHLVDWDEVNPQVRPGPYAYPYGRSMYAYPYSYWGPYGGMGWYGGYPYYPYYGYPYFYGGGFGGGGSAPGGSLPPSAPPQFRKGD